MNMLSVNPQPKLTFIPRANDISINSSDLKIMIRDYKEAIKNELTLPILLALVSLWTPLFTADFRPAFGLSRLQIETGYTVFAFLVSLLFLKPIVMTLLTLIVRFLRLLKLNRSLIQPFQKYETNPDQKVEQMLEDTQNNNVTVKADQLEIIHAIYGFGETFVDVTKKIQESIIGNTLHLVVSNALVPTDPLQGIVKTLIVAYSFENKKETRVYKEGETAKLP